MGDDEGPGPLTHASVSRADEMLQIWPLRSTRVAGRKS